MIRIFILATLILLLFTACASHAQTSSDSDETVAAPPSQEPNATDLSGAGEEPTDSDVMYRIFAAEYLGNEGNLEEAAGEYLEAAMESDDPVIAMRATRVAFAAQAWQQASMAADRWALLDPTNLAARESAALAMLATADYVGAEMQLRELLSVSSDKELAWSQISALLVRSVDPEKAMKVLDRLLSEQGDEGSAAGLYTQSQLAVRTGQIDRAYELAGRAVEAKPDGVEYLSWAGRLALSRGETEAGLDYLRRAWEVKPDDHDLTLAYADLLARNGRVDEARKLTGGMDQTPDVMLTRILFEISADEVDAAMALYEEFRGMTFDDPNEKSFYQARAAESLDLLQEAIEFYTEIEDGGLFLQSTARKAELLGMQGDLEGAKNTLAVLRMQPDIAVVEQSWLTEAGILQQAGERVGALASLDVALEQFGESIPIRYAHALLAAEVGRIGDAEEDLRWILSEQPDHVTALNALGYTLADKTDRYEEAEELISRAYTLQPGDASITDSMGWVSFRLGKFAEAEEYLSSALEMDNNPEIAAHLGEVLWVQEKFEEAKEVFRKGQAVDPDNRTLVETMERLEVKL